MEGRYGLERGVSTGKIIQEQMDEAIKKIKMTTDMDEFCRYVEIVTECVPEDLNPKMKIFAELDKKYSKHTILATNSSGFSVTALAGATETDVDNALKFGFGFPLGPFELSAFLTGRGGEPRRRRFEA